MSEWKPIESAPKEDDILLFSSEDGVRFGYFQTAGYYQDEDGWRCTETQGLTGGRMTPTHWMALPAPPVSETRG